MDLKYVKRFRETQLSREQFQRLKKAVESHGFVPMCTPFDEPSVDLIEKMDFGIIKIASCSFTDWPLLERIVKTDKPLIASTAGAGLEEIDKVVSFFQHREKEFALMHCVGEYPTRIDSLQMNQIDLLKQRYPGSPSATRRMRSPITRTRSSWPSPRGRAYSKNMWRSKLTCSRRMTTRRHPSRLGDGCSPRIGRIE